MLTTLPPKQKQCVSRILLKFSLVAEKNWKEQERHRFDGTFYLISENGKLKRFDVIYLFIFLKFS